MIDATKNFDDAPVPGLPNVQIPIPGDSDEPAGAIPESGILKAENLDCDLLNTENRTLKTQLTLPAHNESIECWIRADWFAFVQVRSHAGNCEVLPLQHCW